MAEESLTKTTVKGVSWSFIDSISSQGITFLVGIVLARLLTPDDYGLLGIISIFISAFNNIVDCGFSNALIRKGNANDKDYNTVFVSNMMVSIVLCLILYFTAPYIAIFFERIQLEDLLKVMSCIVVINAFGIIQRTILIKKIDFKSQAKVSLVSSIISGIIGVGMALNGLGVWALVGQQISRSIFNTVLLWIFAKWYPKIQFSIDSFKELFNFGWKLLVSGLINTLWNEISQVVIGKCYSPATLGQYTRASNFVSICSSNLTSIIQRVSYPVLSSIQNDKERLKAGYIRIIRISMLLSFVLTLGMGACSKSMIQVLIGNQWLPAVPFLQILCFSMALYPLHALNLNMLEVQGRSDLFLKLEIIKKIIAIGPLLLGIFVNIYYMLIANVLLGLFSYYLNAYYSGPFLDYSIKEQLMDILPSFGVAVIMAIPVFAMSFLPMSPFILFPLQIMMGAVITLTICEIVKLPEYMDLKAIAMSVINKIIKRK